MTSLGEVDALVADLPYGADFERAIRVTDETPYSEIAAYLRVYRNDRERVMRTLSYFDATNFAARAAVPAAFSVALLDRVCPPSTVFAIDHHYAGPSTLRVWEFNGHEGGGIDQFVESCAFLGRSLAAGHGVPLRAAALG